ncbi:stage II sporulation protein M [Rubeoparvulum massiliense]|uniref:stage II sporulation protein M n=1 Tax=Rubeoparvulum massiliense TaxID=1631346 RepID=UPI00065E4D54|nr:stage II sporulation protein M [Rubeoparvulum massiliense]
MGRWLQSIRHYKRQFWLAAALLTTAAFIGYFSYEWLITTYEDQFKQLIQPVEEAANKIKEEPTFMKAFTTIFMNNLLASAFIIGSGILFGIIPLVSMVSNGLILGIVLKTGALAGYHPVDVFITSILPHGIFELTAVFLAAALGMHLGWLIIQTIAILWRKQGQRVKLAYLQYFADLPRVFIVIIALLFVAAMIESSLFINAI